MERIRSLFRKAPQLSFQVISDLHLEMNKDYSTTTIPAVSPYLILAGDVGRLADYASYRDFLQKQATNFTLVFLVLGNHEFYGSTYALGIEKAKQLVQEDGLKGKIILLHRASSFLPDNITLVGCTLWSSIDTERNVIKKSIKDFRRIKNWTVDDHNSIHETELEWLEHEVAAIHEQDPARRIIVVTHHAPDMELSMSKAHANKPGSSAFATDLLDVPSKWPGVVMWVFGHTHFTTDVQKGAIRLVANQRGYPVEQQGGEIKKDKDEFDPARIVRI